MQPIILIFGHHLTFPFAMKDYPVYLISQEQWRGKYAAANFEDGTVNPELPAPLSCKRYAGLSPKM